MPKRERYSIADLAAEFDVTPRTIRFYEAEDLIRPERQGQTRIYSHGDRARLAWILRGKRVGFSLAEIREMLDLYSPDDNREAQRTVTLDRCRARIDALKSQRKDIDAMIAELESFCEALKTYRPQPARPPRRAEP